MSRAQASSYLSLLANIKSQTCLAQVHSLLLKTGLDTDPFFAGKLLLSCVDTLSNSLHYARRLFRHFPCPDSFMYNTLIRGQADEGNPFEFFVTFREMRRKDGLGIDSFSFAFVVKAAANLGCLRVGSQVHCLALVYGFNTHLFVGTSLVSFYGECGCVGYAGKVFDEIPEPNVVAWNAVLTAFLRGRDLEGAREVFGLMPFRNLTSWNVMLSGYVKAGEMDVAKEAFWAMPVKDDVSWSTMIVGFAQNGVLSEAFGFFRELMKEGVRPNEASLTGVLSVCALSGAFDSGKMLHGLIEKLGLAWIVSANNALIDVYSKSGNVGMARLVFERMPEKSSVVSWTSMLAGLAMYGHGEEAIQLFHEMEECGIRPDEVTFISLLYACSHAGLVEKGRLYFDKMMNVYNIEPNFEHYGCMVDLHGRAGQLHEAYEFACQMPIEPNGIIWRTLLGACSIHGDVKLAEKVKSRLSELEPGDSGDNVLLSNIYAVSGKWKDVASVRCSMTSQNLKKSPGWSMIEVDKLMYTFVAGANQGKITEDAYGKLKEIMLRLRVEGGYVPEVRSVFYDVEEEEKEDSVWRHSEKLAVAFGIARLCTGNTIQIVKNLRVCMDCHTMMKLISQVYKLEIVVRDRSRFHSFKNGSCSCSDYW